MNQENQIKECLIKKYQIVTKKIEKLSAGSDLNASVYQVHGSTGTNYFLKLRDLQFKNLGLPILDFFRKSAIQNLIFPIASDDQSLSQDIGRFELTLFPFKIGLNGFDRALNDQEWVQLGRCLSTIHALKIPSYIAKCLRQEKFNPDSLMRVKSLLFALSDFRPVDKPGMDFLDLLKSKKNLVENMLEKVESLTTTYMKKKLNMVLCHGDLHGGNVLLTKDNGFYVVDWDDPILAPVERDLMFIGGGVGNVWNNKCEEALFYQGYGSDQVDRKLLAYYRMERILLDLAEYGEALLLKLDNSQDRNLLFKQFYDQFTANGVVDIALKTYSDWAR